MTEAEKQTILMHLNPKPRWLSKLASMLLRDRIITEGVKQLEADYRTRLVEVLRIEVDRYAMGEEYNDEGPILFFEIGDGNILVLWGQWLIDPHVVHSEVLDIAALLDERSWFKRFDLVRAPESGLALSVNGIGRETVLSSGIIDCGQRLPAQPSAFVQGSLDAMFK